MHSKLLLHPKTNLQIKYLLQNPTHAVLISGSSGSGKQTTAQVIAANLLEVEIEKLRFYPYFIHIQQLKNKQDIAIEQVREIIAALKLKTPGRKKIQRVIFIENAHYLSIPAQNALLKVLEEPSMDTVFLLSTTSVQNLLPTIASRAQNIDIQSVTLADAKKYWKEQYSSEQIESAWRLSGGSVGLLSALLSEDQEHPLRKSVQQARKFLSSKTYDRLLILDTLSRNKEQFALFIDALLRILSFLHHSALKNNKIKQAQSLLESRQALQKTNKAMQSNINTKIVALELVHGMKI